MHSNITKRKLKIAQLKVLLSEKPMTSYELASKLKVSYSCVADYIAALRKNKELYIFEWKQTKGQSQRAWALGNCEDAPFVGKGKRKERKVQQHKPVQVVKPRKFKPRPDIAAAWMFNKVEL